VVRCSCCMPQLLLQVPAEWRSVSDLWCCGLLSQMLAEDSVPPLPHQNSLLLPPAPIVKQDNWPLLTISKGFFETLAAKGAAAAGAGARRCWCWRCRRCCRCCCCWPSSG